MTPDFLPFALPEEQTACREAIRALAASEDAKARYLPLDAGTVSAAAVPHG